MPRMIDLSLLFVEHIELRLLAVRITETKRCIFRLGELIHLHHSHPQLCPSLDIVIYARLEVGQECTGQIGRAHV